MKDKENQAHEETLNMQDQINKNFGTARQRVASIGSGLSTFVGGLSSAMMGINMFTSAL
jgi:hypothetical protein